MVKVIHVRMRRKQRRRDPPPPTATVFITYRYGSVTGWLFQKIYINFVTWGYAVFAADLLGHGRSDSGRV
ncbi:hypothetical protein AAHE18_14G016200 [Arachis hypogaea]